MAKQRKHSTRRMLKPITRELDELDYSRVEQSKAKVLLA